MSPATGFDRLRRRTAQGSSASPPVAVDAEGKRALFSISTTRQLLPPLGLITVACSRCGETSIVGARQALRVLAPSVHLPLLGRTHPSFLRCPACKRPSWVRLRVRVR